MKTTSIRSSGHKHSSSQPKHVPQASALAAVHPLTIEDITGDIERLIGKIVAPYVDQSNPLLHFEDLQAECRFKLARIISDGRLVKCPTRSKAFAFIKTAFKNHVRSLVQKYAFTAKRGGVSAPRRHGPTRLEWNRKESPKAYHVSINDPDTPIQIGISDENLPRLSFLEELAWRLSPLEQALFGHLMLHDKHVAGAEADAIPSNEHTDAFLAAHSLTASGYEAAKSRLRAKCYRVLEGR